MKEFLSVICVLLIFSASVFVLCDKINDNISQTVSAITSNNDIIVILDAGHGGEDGGCVAYDNTLEKDINLQITDKISFMFDIFGIDYIQIRTEDISVGDNDLQSIKARKTSDIIKRFDTVNSYPNSVLLSIHQNMYSVEKYSGTQVFYSPNDNESKILADSIQSVIKNNIQQDNDRQTKASGDSIYLLYHAKRPSVMVECGFFSNMAELEKLKTPEYQVQMAYFITRGLINYSIIKE